jgi:hypothetical protein
LTCETASVSPRVGMRPAAAESVFRSDASCAAGIELSTMTATSRRSTLPGATSVCEISLPIAYCVVPWTWL